MSAGGVIPPPAARRSYVRIIGHAVDSTDGLDLEVGVDHDTVTIGCGLTQWRLARHEAEEFARLFVAACWEAGANAQSLQEVTAPF